jgi:hypothetical protein
MIYYRYAICSVKRIGKQLYLLMNRIELNRVELNRVELNGVELNGVELNGVELNRLKLIVVIECVD